MRLWTIAASLCLAWSTAHADAKVADINGAKISYEVCGDEKAQGVVLLHDGMANSAAWDGVWPGLCAKYRVVRYDRRGYGKSPAAQSAHSPTEDLAGVMKLAGLDHAHFIGASSGAGIAIDFLFEQPEAIDKLVLVAPSVSGLNVADAFMARLRALEDVVITGDMDKIIAAINADPHFISPEYDDARKKLEAIVRASPGDLGAHPLQRRPLNMAQRVQEIYAPTLILVGSNDHPYVQAVGAAIGGRMRSAKTQLLLGQGYFLYLEDPAGFVGIVSGFLG